MILTIEPVGCERLVHMCVLTPIPQRDPYSMVRRDIIAAYPKPSPLEELRTGGCTVILLHTGPAGLNIRNGGYDMFQMHGFC